MSGSDSEPSSYEAARRRVGQVASNVGRRAVEDLGLVQRELRRAQERTWALMEFAASAAQRSAAMHREVARAQERLATKLTDASGAHKRQLLSSAEAHRDVADLDDTLAEKDRASEV